jgi:hypothetical protein
MDQVHEPGGDFQCYTPWSDISRISAVAKLLCEQKWLATAGISTEIKRLSR